VGLSLRTRRAFRAGGLLALLVDSLLLAACGGDVFSAGPDSGSDAAGEVGAPGDGSGGGPDATADAGPTPDGAVHDSAIHDAPAAHDAVAIGCDAAGVTQRVFVTAQQFSISEVGSLANADKLCQTAATNAGLGGTFVAWLSDDQTSAMDRICPTSAPFVLVDGVTLVTKGTSGLTSGTLLHAIDETETGHSAPTSPTACGDTRLAVWTGTESTGMGQASYNCQGWTSSAANADGVVGFAQATNGSWTYGCSGMVCGGTASLYCIQQ
jgi:hypothetical protein